MTRLKAAATHLLISATLSTIVICLLLFYWYPLPFFWALGGMLLLTLIIGIDVVLGPVMTLILFNPKKSRRALTVDLTLIAIVQISALSYGLYSGYVSRLVFSVFDGKSFQLVQAGDVAGNFLAKTNLPDYQQLPLFGQKFAALQVPDDERTRSDLAFFKALGAGPQVMPNYYVALDSMREQLSKAAIAKPQLQTKHPTLVAKIDGLLREKNLNWQDILVIPFDVKTTTYTAVMSLKPVSVIKILSETPR